ncbi:MAG: tol-pal system protein YbgF [Pseudomonadota bacterium]
MGRISLFAVAVALWPLGAPAQDAQTLADIRQELTILYVEVQRLKRELSTTGSPSVVTGGGSVLERINTIEGELQRLTAETEQLEFRVNRIVQDGTNRIGDLEFRLVELEGGDISALGETTTLGGPVETATPPGAAPVAPAPAPATPDGSQLAIGEEDDFKSAQTALAEGRYQEAADQFAAFSLNYPGGPLASGAALGRGEALEALGDTREAAREYLNSFNADPTGPVAAQSLFRLGRSLGALGQTEVACVTLSEVGIRFPGNPAVAQAEEARQALPCP